MTEQCKASREDFYGAIRDADLLDKGIYFNGKFNPKCTDDLFELIRAKDREIAELLARLALYEPGKSTPMWDAYKRGELSIKPDEVATK